MMVTELFVTFTNALQEDFYVVGLNTMTVTAKCCQAVCVVVSRHPTNISSSSKQFLACYRTYLMPLIPRPLLAAM